MSLGWSAHGLMLPYFLLSRWPIFQTECKSGTMQFHKKNSNGSWCNCQSLLIFDPHSTDGYCWFQHLLIRNRILTHSGAHFSKFKSTWASLASKLITSSWGHAPQSWLAHSRWAHMLNYFLVGASPDEIQESWFPAIITTLNLHT